MCLKIKESKAKRIATAKAVSARMVLLKKRRKFLNVEVMKSIGSRVEFMKFGVNAMEKATAKFVYLLVLLLYAEDSRGIPPRTKDHSDFAAYEDLRCFTFAIGGLLLIKMVYQKYKNVFDYKDHKDGCQFKRKTQRKENFEKYQNTKA